MKRRDTRKRIRDYEQELLPVAKKYLNASDRVHRDVLNSYANQMEKILFGMAECYLQLDRSWPHRERWLDGLEECVWQKSGSTLRVDGELWWGTVANVAGAETKQRCCIVLQPKRKKLIYSIVVGAAVSGSLLVTFRVGLPRFLILEI